MCQKELLLRSSFFFDQLLAKPASCPKLALTCKANFLSEPKDDVIYLFIFNLVCVLLALQLLSNEADRNPWPKIMSHFLPSATPCSSPKGSHHWDTPLPLFLCSLPLFRTFSGVSPFQIHEFCAAPFAIVPLMEDGWRKALPAQPVMEQTRQIVVTRSCG